MTARKRVLKIKLLGRNVEIVVASHDAPGSDMVDGAAKFKEGRVAVSADSNRIHTVFHELCHIFHERTGIDWDGSYTPEHIADTFGAIVRALVEENGLHIMERIIRFVIGEQGGDKKES